MTLVYVPQRLLQLDELPRAQAPEPKLNPGESA